MDKNLRVGGRFVDKDDNLLMVVSCPSCTGCFYSYETCNRCSVLAGEDKGKPYCTTKDRADDKSVIFVPTTEPAQEKPSGRTVAEIQGEIERIVTELVVPRAGGTPEHAAERIAAREALMELAEFIEPPAMTFLEAVRHRVNGNSVRRRGWAGKSPWGPGTPPQFIDEEDIDGTDWEIVPETNTDGS